MISMSPTAPEISIIFIAQVVFAEIGWSGQVGSEPYVIKDIQVLLGH